MLNAITVEGYRGFVEKATIVLRPITILLGRNSSGKSSLTRLFPLLQQSVETPSSSPVLWAAEHVDLGNIADIKTHDADGEVRLGFEVDTGNLMHFMYTYRYANIFSLDPTPSDMGSLEYIIRLDAQDLRTILKGIEFKFAGSSLSIDCDAVGSVQEVQVDGRRLPLAGNRYVLDTTSLFPDITFADPSTRLTHTHRTAFYPELISTLKKIIHGRTSLDKLQAIVSSMPYIPKKDARKYVEQIPNTVKKKITSSIANAISEESFFNEAPSLIDFLQISLAQIFRDVSYIGPFRAAGQRFNRIQELAVNRIDAAGANTAMYLYSLTPKQLDSFNVLMERACGYVVTVEASGPGHISIKLGRRSTQHSENIADVGFGFSQLLPVVAQLHALSEKDLRSPARGFAGQRIFAVEQPELHLHPGLQRNLADLFTETFANSDTNPIQLTGVFETHSEAMVQRFGELISEGSLSPNDVSLVFVEKDRDGELTRIRQTSFNDDGIVEDWPVGFFSS